MATQDLGAQVREGPMRPVQILAVTICVVINAIDGFDILAMAFTAPAIAEDWNLPATALGVLFSASLAGMALGSVLLAPFADKFGRRKMILFGLALITFGMFAVAWSSDVAHLAWMRFITGLGIGAVLPSLNTVVAEYASNRRRDLSISLMTVGYSIGATLGGLIAVYLITQHGWQSVFILGGVLSALMIPVVYFGLPESIDFLVVRRPAGALERLNALLVRLGAATVDALPAPARADGVRPRFIDIFAPGLRMKTVLTCTIFFLVMTTFYFLTSWTPKMLVDLGLSLSGGISGAVMMSLVGVVGGVVLGALVPKVGLNRIGATFMIACFFAVAAFGFSPVNAGLLITLAGAIGFFMNGAVVTLYSLAPRVFPPAVRATGTGLALGFGRLGATVGPYIAGVLIASGWERGAYSLALAVPMLLGAGVLQLIVTQASTPSTPTEPAAVRTH